MVATQVRVGCRAQQECYRGSMAGVACAEERGPGPNYLAFRPVNGCHSVPARRRAVWIHTSAEVMLHRGDIAVSRGLLQGGPALVLLTQLLHAIWFTCFASCQGLAGFAAACQETGGSTACASPKALAGRLHVPAGCHLRNLEIKVTWLRILNPAIAAEPYNLVSRL